MCLYIYVTSFCIRTLSHMHERYVIGVCVSPLHAYARTDRTRPLCSLVYYTRGVISGTCVYVCVRTVKPLSRLVAAKNNTRTKVRLLFREQSIVFFSAQTPVAYNFVRLSRKECSCVSVCFFTL